MLYVPRGARSVKIRRRKRIGYAQCDAPSSSGDPKLYDVHELNAVEYARISQGSRVRFIAR